MRAAFQHEWTPQIGQGKREKISGRWLIMQLCSRFFPAATYLRKSFIRKTLRQFVAVFRYADYAALWTVAGDCRGGASTLVI
jgi:hypothetical protein